LQEECVKSRTLRVRVQQLEADGRVANERIQRLAAREKDIVEKSQEQIRNLQQTISLLVSEKASLTASLDRLEDLESRTR
jgi:prefoldin subunit 5